MGRKTRKRRLRRRKTTTMQDSFMRFERVCRDKRLRPEPQAIKGCGPV